MYRVFNDILIRPGGPGHDKMQSSLEKSLSRTLWDADNADSGTQTRSWLERTIEALVVSYRLANPES